MNEYSYADVIIDPEDPRVEIGGKYYFDDSPYQCICNANNNAISYTLQGVDVGSYRPFIHDCIGFICLIRKKEPEKKYVPFDLLNEEDRAKLRGAWIREKDSGRERSITGLFLDEKPPYVEISDEGYSSEYLLENYEFVDGTPCGKPVEKA